MARLGNSVGITDAKILGLKSPASGQVEVADNVVGGLRVRIGASGVRTFILRKRIGGKQHNLTLGRYGPRFTLADARKKARGLLVDIESGGDPTATLVTPRSRASELGTVRELWTQYLEREVTGRKRSAGEIERIGARHILPAIGNRLADSITRADVTRLVEAVAFARPDKPTPRMGRAVHSQLSAFYSWAMPKLDRLPANPCRDAGRPAASKARDRYLDKAEIKAFWAACDRLGYPFREGFKLLLLTAQRRGEVFDADRAEFDGDTWTIPAARSKNGVASIVPLANPVLTIVDAIPEFGNSAKLFPSRTNGQTSASGFSKAFERLCSLMAAEMGVDAVQPFRLHDLRRTAATGMQRLGIAQTVVEALLNHVSGSRAGIVGVYQRHHFTDEKRHALEAWAAEIERIVAGSSRANVVHLRSGSSQ